MFIVISGTIFTAALKKRDAAWVVSMKINADFDSRVVVHSAQLEWLESPMKGVYRRPLDRIGAEVARATSIVKYDPNSKFSPHTHTGGEEFFVLDGVFQDESGDYPSGSYIRNPPQSRHTPGSESGCIIFVKLWQFMPEDRTHVCLNTNFMQAVPHRGMTNVSVMPLYKDDYEEVSIEYWAANSMVTVEADNGLEVLVIDGSFVDGEDSLVKHSWVRLGGGDSLNAKTGAVGAKVWVKRNHLKNVDDQILRVSSVK